MGIFSRLADIVNSNVNSILDRAEEPEKIIRLIIQEMEDTLVEVRTAAAKTIAERKEVQRALDRLAEAKAEWQRKAELALGRNREDLSRAALMEKAKVAETAADLQEELDELDTALSLGDADISALEGKLRQTKAKQQVIQARHDNASTRIKVRRKLYDSRVKDAFSRFEQVEKRLDAAEGEIEAFDLGRSKTLNEEIAELESESDIEEELAALKAKLAKRGKQNAQARK